MDFLNAVLKQFTGFFGFNHLLQILKSGDYDKLLTYEGFTALLVPVMPFLLVIEIIRAAFYKRFKVISYKLTFFSYVFNAFIGRVISIAMVGICIGLFEKYAIFKLSFTW